MKLMARNGINLALAMALLGLAAFAQTQPVSNSQSSTQPTSSLGDYARQVHKDTGHKTRSFDNDNLPKDDKLSIVGSSDSTSTSEPSAATTPEEPSTPKAEEPAAKASDSTTTSESETKTESKSAKSGSHSSPEGKPKNTAPSGTSADAEAAPAPPKSEPAKPVEEKAAAPAPTAAPASTDQEANGKQAEWKQWGQKINSEKEQIDLAERELNVLQREYQIRAAAMYGDAGNRLRNQADWDKQDAQYKQQLADKQKALEDAKQKLDDMQEDARRAGVPESVREPD